MNNEEEIWKDIEEFKGYYQVSNFGNAKRIAPYKNQCAEWECSGEPLKPKDNGNDYLCLILSVNNKHYTRYIHRLVAKEFCKNPNPEEYNEVNHIDGNKQNNHADNLEWVDHSMNGLHAYRTGLRTVKGCFGRKKPVYKLDLQTLWVLEWFESCEKAAKSVGIGYASICSICSYNQDHSRYKRPIYSCKGYQWIYADDSYKIGDIVDLH